MIIDLINLLINWLSDLEIYIWWENTLFLIIWGVSFLLILFTLFSKSGWAYFSFYIGAPFIIYYIIFDLIFWSIIFKFPNTFENNDFIKIINAPLYIIGFTLLFLWINKSFSLWKKYKNYKNIDIKEISDDNLPFKFDEKWCGEIEEIEKTFEGKNKNIISYLIDSPQGSGKTSFTNMLKTRILENKEDNAIIQINTADFDQEKKPLLLIAQKILDSCVLNYKDYVKLENLMWKGSITLWNNTFTQNPNDNIQKILDIFKDKNFKWKKNVYVFIDELDRINTKEYVKDFFTFSNDIFNADTKEIKKYNKDNNRKQNDSKDKIVKIFYLFDIYAFLVQLRVDVSLNFTHQKNANGNNEFNNFAKYFDKYWSKEIKIKFYFHNVFERLNYNFLNLEKNQIINERNNILKSFLNNEGLNFLNNMRPSNIRTLGKKVILNYRKIQKSEDYFDYWFFLNKLFIEDYDFINFPQNIHYYFLNVLFIFKIEKWNNLETDKWQKMVLDIFSKEKINTNLNSFIDGLKKIHSISFSKLEKINEFNFKNQILLLAILLFKISDNKNIFEKIFPQEFFSHLNFNLTRQSLNSFKYLKVGSNEQAEYFEYNHNKEKDKNSVFYFKKILNNNIKIYLKSKINEFENLKKKIQNSGIKSKEVKDNYNTIFEDSNLMGFMNSTNSKIIEFKYFKKNFTIINNEIFFENYKIRWKEILFENWEKIIEQILGKTNYWIYDDDQRDNNYNDTSKIFYEKILDKINLLIEKKSNFKNSFLKKQFDAHIKTKKSILMKEHENTLLLYLNSIFKNNAAKRNLRTSILTDEFRNTVFDYFFIIIIPYLKDHYVSHDFW